jgi:hypothetical protein
MRRRLQRHDVLVNLKSGKAFRGILWTLGARYVVLRQAQLMHEGHTVPIDGEVIVERRDVEFYQVVQKVSG